MAKTVKRKKKYNNIKNTIYTVSVVIVVVAVVLVGVWNRLFPKDNSPKKQSAVTVSELNDLTIKFIDVGQGDAILINFPDGKNMIVDFNKCDSAIVDKYLKKDGKKLTIDYLVATHPDEDHIGQLPYIYENYDVNYSFRPFVLSENEKSVKFGSDFNVGVDINKSTKIYHDYIDGVYNEDKTAWEFFTDKSDFSCAVTYGESTYTYSVDFAMPYADTTDGFKDFKDANDFSAIIMIEYCGKKILLMGDAESHNDNGAEDKFVTANQYNKAVDCDVLKVGHHGSNTSSSLDFLNLVRPEYAVISCGAGNTYSSPSKTNSHPDVTTIDKLINLQSEVYRTDLQGTVTLTVNCLGEINFAVETHENDGYLLQDGHTVYNNESEINANKEKARKKS